MLKYFQIFQKKTVTNKMSKIFLKNSKNRNEKNVKMSKSIQPHFQIAITFDHTNQI